MARILAIAGKDLSQILRDRRSAVFLVLMPVVFTAFLGLAFRWPSSADSRPLVGIADPDSSGFGAALVRMLESTGTARVTRLDRADARRGDELVRRGRLDAVVLVPADPALSPHVVADRAEPGGAAAVAALQSAAGRVRLSAGISRLIAAEVPGTDSAALLAVALDAWRTPALRLRREGGRPQPSRITPSGFSQSSPGTLIQFAIFGMMTAAMLLVTERRSRALARMLATPASRVEVIAGHVLAMFAVTLAQSLLLVAFGRLVLGVNYTAQPAAVLVLLVALSLWVASLGLFIGTVARGQEQVSLLSMVAMFGFSAGGGAWFPLELTGRVFSFIGHLLPSAWAMDGLQNVAVRGLGFSSVVAPALVLAGYAAVFFALAVWRFRAETA